LMQSAPSAPPRTPPTLRRIPFRWQAEKGGITVEEVRRLKKLDYGSVLRAGAATPPRARGST